MKTSNNPYNLLLEQTTSLYRSEKKIGDILSGLQAKTIEAAQKEGITREAEENKRHCVRLEGLLAVLNQAAYQSKAGEIEKANFVHQLSIMHKRIAAKHACFGYQTAILVAQDQGQNEVVSLLRNVLSTVYNPIKNEA